VALMAWVVAPFDQRYDVPALEVSVTLPPAQKVVAPPAVMVGVAGLALTVTVMDADVALQPLALVTVTLKVPEAVTLMAWVVAPFDQRYELPALAVSVTLPPVQKVVAPLGVITAAGLALTVTAVAAEVEPQPLAFVTVTLYEPEVVTLMACVVAPFDQRYELPALAVSVTLPPAQKVVGPPAVIAGVAGLALTVTAVAADVALQPLAFVTVTLYEPEAVALMAWVVAPVDQRYELPALAVSVTLPPAQKVVGPPALIDGVGLASTVTVVAADAALQPLAFVTVTLYEPEAVALMACVAAPVDQRYELPVLAVSITLPPAQKVVGPPALIDGVGLASTVTAVAAEAALQPLAFVTVTLYEPAAVALMAWVVAPVDQRYELPALAVSVTLSPAQKVVGPPAVIAGVAGLASTVTFVAADVALQPLAFVTVTLYEPAAVALIAWVVAPFDQRYEPPALAVRVTLPPAQKVVGPPAVIDGAAGVSFTVTTNGADVALQPFAVVTVTM
jgi:hypothetical protein